MSKEKLAEVKAEYDEWFKKHSPMIFLENDGEGGDNFKLAESAVFGRVWTNHGTCESERVTAGFHMFNSVCGCWDVYGWWLTEEDFGNTDEYESYDTCFSCECDCVVGESGEASDGCLECDGSGIITHYFD